MTIHMRDLKGVLDMENDRRMSEYERNLRFTEAERAAANHGDVLYDSIGITLILFCTIAGWMIVIGAFMVNGGAAGGWMVSVAGVIALVLAVHNLMGMSTE